MHNSEQGAAVSFKRDDASKKVFTELPFTRLLKTDCIGCHSDSGSETIITIGATRIPIVYNFLEPTYPPDGSSSSSLAGGNFYWVAQQDGDRYGHNVYGISEPDLLLGGDVPAPGGTVTEECAICHRTLATEETGCNGCHVPRHHTLGNNVVSGKDEGWYRFLGLFAPGRDELDLPSSGVSGIEDPKWEQAPSATSHNTYQGSTVPYTADLNTKSISQFCSGCHGLYHNETADNSVWIRHPVEVSIPNSGEFTDFNDYNPLVPVAKQDPTEADVNSPSIDLGSDMVSCLSCHRAHGSPYPAMLRWAYRAWPGIDPYTGQDAVNGCVVCHTTKD